MNAIEGSARLDFDCTPHDLWSVAIHESGHAVVGVSIGLPISYATVRPRPGDRGHVCAAIGLGKMTLSQVVLFWLAGEVAARMFLDPVEFAREDGSQPDLHVVRTVLVAMYSLSRRHPGVMDRNSVVVTAALARWRRRVARRVYRQSPWIIDVAIALMRSETLSGTEILRLRNASKG